MNSQSGAYKELKHIKRRGQSYSCAITTRLHCLDLSRVFSIYYERRCKFCTACTCHTLLAKWIIGAQPHAGGAPMKWLMQQGLIE